MACKLVLLVCAAALVGVASARSVSADGSSGRAAQEVSGWLGDLRAAYRVYGECAAQDLSTCLKLKLVSALDRAARSVNDVEVVDGVSLVRDAAAAATEASASAGAKSEQQLAEELPRALGDRDDALNSMIADRALSFLQSHTLQLKFPSALTEEGRKKKNNMGGLLLLPLLMGAMMVPLALGGLALLAGKALLVSKLALVLAGVIGLKKLLSGSHGGGGEYQVAHHHGRSLDAAHDLAYRAHAPSPSA
ncbi:hypothetical protein R5R35_006920 [Gryllus longicercus]|uniref:Uncharacterized protein n=1 Tax=Gryllus longicercus TaxID=2509291 RepID=A0AAN9VYG0_9ORTH